MSERDVTVIMNVTAGAGSSTRVRMLPVRHGPLREERSLSHFTHRSGASQENQHNCALPGLGLPLQQILRLLP